MIGLSLSDFCRLTPEEYYEVSKAYHGQCDFYVRDAWERDRKMTNLIYNLFTKNKVPPEAMLIFPWDKEKKARPQVSKEESRRRFEALQQRIKNTDNG